MWNFLKSIFSLRRLKPDPNRFYFGNSNFFYKKKNMPEDQALTVSAFYRGITYLASNISKIPIDLKDKDEEKININNIDNILNLSSNTWSSSFHVKYYLILKAILNGNAYAEIERDMMGRAIALWPLFNVSVVPKIKDGELIYECRGSRAKAELEPMDIFHLRNVHTKNGFMGIGTLTYASEVLGIAKHSNDLAEKVMSSGGMPNIVIRVKESLSDEAYQRMKESWASKEGGPAILEQDSDAKSLSLNPNDLQFLDSRKFSIAECARFLGVPPEKLFDTTLRRTIGAEDGAIKVVRDTLDTWATIFEQEIDKKLLFNRLKGRHSKFDLYSISRGDMAARSEFYLKMHAIGALSSNEIRKKEGMPGYEGGDKHFIEVNNKSPVDRIDEMIDANIASKKKSNTPTEPGGGDNGE